MLAMGVTLLLLASHGVSNTSCPQMPLSSATQGEMTSAGYPLPADGDYRNELNAPVQVPLLVPTQGMQLVVISKSRVSTSVPTNLLRRSLNRLSGNVYAPLSASGRLVLERLSSPLRVNPVIRYYVLELCRLLC